MASHEPFGHQQPKLWSKERPRVKLAVWLPTIKSQESTRFRCVQVKCDTPLKSSQRELQLWFRPCPDPSLGRGVMSVQSPEIQTGQFRDSILGVPGKRAIWMQVRRKATENTIWGKVVASLESRPWWVKWVQGRLWLVPTPKRCKMSSN
jgi:hypothetical protein